MINKMKLGVLGPGTNSRIAADTHLKEYEIVDYVSMGALFEGMRGREIERILVPVWNNLTGEIDEHLRMTVVYDLKKIEDFSMPINHTLFAGGGTALEDVGFVISHEQALLQCKEFLDKNCPSAGRYALDSTGEAARLISKVGGNGGAIANYDSGLKYNLKILAENIAPKSESVFWVCKRRW